MLPNGTRVSLGGPLLLGRDPAGITDRPDAGLLPLTDRGKTVSKTHALLEPAPGGVRVRDLHSTNGVAV
ncbi:MAG TPA: FHA domain-containing protein, partial [Pseudolysinimonas sp.]|nr:FHA domain-containing protein [Pseudolysinimonas sp.]